MPLGGNTKQPAVLATELRRALVADFESSARHIQMLVQHQPEQCRARTMGADDEERPVLGHGSGHATAGGCARSRMIVAQHVLIALTVTHLLCGGYPFGE